MSEGTSRELTIVNQKGKQVEFNPTDFPIGDRTSNGSFVLDEKQGGEIIAVLEAPVPKIEE